MTISPRKTIQALVIAGFSCAFLAGCGDVEQDYPEHVRGESSARVLSPAEKERQKQGGVFGPGGLTLLGSSDRKEEASRGGADGIGVNSFLWRGALDTIGFMPLVSADPFGGVIITDWYAMPEAPDERFKINVYILGRSLRADGVKVAVFRQVQGQDGAWQDASVPAQTASSIEDSILTRARQLRFDTMQQ